jgi:hypothetical protein
MSRKLTPRTVQRDSHYLVRYLCDRNLQVRSRAHFKCKRDSAISTGNTYKVQWGRVKEVDEAIVLHSGTEQEMRQKYLELMDSLSTTSSSPSTSPPPSPKSPSPPPTPRLTTPPPLAAPKRWKTNQQLVSWLNLEFRIHWCFYEYHMTLDTLNIWHCTVLGNHSYIIMHVHCR